MFQILDAMNQDSGIPLTQLGVDGGMTANRLLMQLQADILCIPVGNKIHYKNTHLMLDGLNKANEMINAGPFIYVKMLNVLH